MEMGHSDGERIDKFLSSGDISDMNRVALYGYSSPYLRKPPGAGNCPLVSNPYPDFFSLFKQEEVWFYSHLYKIGRTSLPQSERLHHFGFDIDTRPGGAYEDIDVALKPFAKHSVIVNFMQALSPVLNESLVEEISRLDNSLSHLSSQGRHFRQIMGGHRLNWLKLSLKTLIESLRFELVFYSRPCEPADLTAWNTRLLEAMAARERMMFELMKQRLQDLGPQAKIVLMGHNFHLSKEPRSLWFARASVPESSAPVMWPSIGQYVTSTLNIPVYSIWMIQRQGFQSNIDCPQVECAVDNGTNYLGEMLSGFGSWLTLPVNNPPSILGQRLDFTVNGGTYSGNVSKNADLIFFVDTVSGLHSR